MSLTYVGWNTTGETSTHPSTVENHASQARTWALKWTSTQQGTFKRIAIYFGANIEVTTLKAVVFVDGTLKLAKSITPTANSWVWYSFTTDDLKRGMDLTFESGKDIYFGISAIFGSTVGFDLVYDDGVGYYSATLVTDPAAQLSSYAWLDAGYILEYDTTYSPTTLPATADGSLLFSENFDSATYWDIQGGDTKFMSLWGMNSYGTTTSATGAFVSGASGEMSTNNVSPQGGKNLRVDDRYDSAENGDVICQTQWAQVRRDWGIKEVYVSFKWYIDPDITLDTGLDRTKLLIFYDNGAYTGGSSPTPWNIYVKFLDPPYIVAEYMDGINDNNVEFDQTTFALSDFSGHWMTWDFYIKYNKLDITKTGVTWNSDGIFTCWLTKDSGVRTQMGTATNVKYWGGIQTAEIPTINNIEGFPFQLQLESGVTHWGGHSQTDDVKIYYGMPVGTAEKKTLFRR